MERERDWQSGGAEAFAHLVRRWQQPVARFLFHLVGRDEPIADLCQEVFLRVYEHRGRYQETGAFSRWLFRIALNVVRDASRRRRPQSCDLGADELADARPSPDAACAQAEHGRLVVQAIAELPESQRIVLVLRHYEEMRFEQIAHLLGEPASTIKSRFRAALQRLRERLRPYCDDLTEPQR